MEKRGYFISFEGLDGAGKTTQVRLLGEWLQERQFSHVLTREPGGTPLGQELRQLLFYRPEFTITPLTEAFLLQADRAQHFETLVRPSLAQGNIVVTDRCYDSSVVYQGVVRGVGVELVEELSRLSTEGLAPDLTILLDLDPALVHQRTSETSEQREPQSRFDKESLLFHQQLRHAFLMLARRHPERIKIIDATQSTAAIHSQIATLVEALLHGMTV